jgi:CDP-glucose 4,6-dehydratase
MADAVASLKPRLPSAAFWKGRRVLLTGHTGFKGSWAALWLGAMGADVTGFALEPDSEPSLFKAARVADGIASRIGDLRAPEAVRAAVEAARPEIVIHMAAQPIVRRAIAEPVETIATNILGTAHLLDALRGCESLKVILVVTSDKVYANSETGRPFTEADRLGGKDPYSASKAGTELVAQSFAGTYFNPRGVVLAAARGGNVIGGGDFATDRIVPDIYRAIARGERLVLRMPEATRPWQHVLDCVAGYLVYAEALAHKGDTPRALNFGPEPGGDATVATLAGAILRAFGKPAEWDFQPVEGSVEMKALAVDSTLARQTLGWCDCLAGEKIVSWTADWYRRVIAGEDARKVTLAQIAEYAALSG